MPRLTHTLLSGIIILVLLCAPLMPVVQAEETTNDGSVTSDMTEEESDPVLVETETTSIEDEELPEETGSLSQTATDTVQITTGNASSQGEIINEVNSNPIQSNVPTNTNMADDNTSTSSQTTSSSTEITTSNVDQHSPVNIDIDDYEVTATGTNTATVENFATTTAGTGYNKATSATAIADISTGDALAMLNIANIVNTNVINSTGTIQLINKWLSGLSVLDISKILFPDPEAIENGASDCSLISCLAENIKYFFSSENQATIDNNAALDATTGVNDASGKAAFVTTGDAYAGANIMNVANTNIIDSQYNLLTLNGFGDLQGDLILPNSALLKAFFGKPNGVNQVEDIEDAVLTNRATNTAAVNNNVLTTAETGLNTASTTGDALIETGTGYADINVLDDINKNLFGGDSLYIKIRVHGGWNGNIYGLPDGISATTTPDGIIIYNTEDEIEVSEMIASDVDSYTAEFQNVNDVKINNNVNLNALSGDNQIDGEVGEIKTGDAFAGANVMNIANTNVVGKNWMVALLNIFGNFDGDISFGQPDLWVGGQVKAAASPVGPGTLLTYTYTVTNNGDLTAKDVILTQELYGLPLHYSQNEHVMRGGARHQSVGTVAAGKTVQTTMTLTVDEDLPYGEYDLEVPAHVSSDEPDFNLDDNTETLSLRAIYTNPNVSSGGGGQSSTGGSGGSGSGGSGGGGGSSSSRDSVSKSSDTKLSREKKENVKDPIPYDSTSMVTISKTADYDDGDIVQAGQSVNYVITVKNQGGAAYNAVVVDTLLNPIGSTVSEQSWDLGTIEPGEVIELAYTTTFNGSTPSGTYTNTASIVAYRNPDDKKQGVRPLRLPAATHTLTIQGNVKLAVGNVQPLAYFPTSDGSVMALMMWETSHTADGQIFFGPSKSLPVYSPTSLNYGYQFASTYYATPTTKHYMLLRGLEEGQSYTYRIRSASADNTAFGGPYQLSVPAVVARPMLAQTIVAEQ